MAEKTLQLLSSSGWSAHYFVDVIVFSNKIQVQTACHVAFDLLSPYRVLITKREFCLIRND